MAKESSFISKASNKENSVKESAKDSDSHATEPAEKLTIQEEILEDELPYKEKDEEKALDSFQNQTIRSLQPSDQEQEEALPEVSPPKQQEQPRQSSEHHQEEEPEPIIEQKLEPEPRDDI